MFVKPLLIAGARFFRRGGLFSRRCVEERKPQFLMPVKGAIQPLLMRFRSQDPTLDLHNIFAQDGILPLDIRSRVVQGVQ